MTYEDQMHLADVFSSLEVESSRSSKEAILRRNASFPLFKECLVHLFNPYITTGIKRAKLDNSLLQSSMSDTTIELEAILEFYKQSHTGVADEIKQAQHFIYQYGDPMWQWFAECLITKDIQCGISATTVNKVFPNLIPIIGIMRGKQAPEYFNGCYIATEKIDGNRRLFFNFKDGVKTYTRSGKPDAGLKQIENEIHQYLPTGYVYDCECIAMGDFTDNIALRQASASILNTKSTEKTNIIAWCFDMVEINDYNKRLKSTNAATRKMLLAGYLGDSRYDIDMLRAYTMVEIATAASINFANRAHTFEFIKALPILGIVHNQNEARILAEPIWQSGGEGLMLVDIASPYYVSSSPQKSWLKIKATIEVEALCTDIYAGDIGKKYENSLGGILIAFKGPDGKIYECCCGSGFTDNVRAYYYKYPKDIIGKTVEIDCFGYSQAQGSTGYSLNCPIFKRVKGDVD